MYTALRRSFFFDGALLSAKRFGQSPMTDIFTTSNRLALFIDGLNLHASGRALGFDVDFKRLRSLFEKRGNLLRAHYYTMLLEDQEFSGVRPLIDWLGYNGFIVVTRTAREFVETGGRRKIAGSMGVALSVDALQLAGHIDQMVLFSGDGDFRPLVDAMQRRGVQVIVVSTIAPPRPMISDDLRRQADGFVDLVDLRPLIERVPCAPR